MRFDPDVLNDPRHRGRALRYTVIGVFALLLFRLLWLQVAQGAHYRELSEENRIRVQIMTAPRGEIRDRKGRLLADNVPSFTVTVDPYHGAYLEGGAALDSTLARLAAILAVDVEELAERVRRERGRSFLPVRLRRNVDLSKVAVVAEHRDRLPGVEVETEPLRRYPHGEVGSHLLGYVGEISDQELENSRDTDYLRGDLLGRMGIERQYEAALRGAHGKQFVEVNALGRKAELLGDKRPILPRRGADLTLTVDLDLQRAAEDAFVPGARGALVALDPRSGDVLALVSKPNFDPNEFSVGVSHERWSELSGGGNYPLFNRAIQAAYPPGSALKPFVALAGLTSGSIREGTTFREPCTGSFRFGRRPFGCWDRSGHGWLAMREAVARSCDVYFYQLGLRIRLERLAGFMRGLELSERTGIDLPQERKGLFPDPAWYDRRYGVGRWSRGLLLNLSIGQGETSMTPVKLAQLTALVANGGTLATPRLVRSISAGVPSRGEALEPPEAKGRHLGLSDSDVALTRAAMVAVVNDPRGTGGVARLDSVLVAGKTGTAQNPHGEDHALFICFAPARSPEIAIAVVVENAGHGGSKAAPIARRVLDAYFHPAPGESAAVLAGR